MTMTTSFWDACTVCDGAGKFPKWTGGPVDVCPRCKGSGQEPPRDRQLEVEFQRFHHDNPWVYDELVKLARQARQRGLQKIGIGLLWEVMRWNRMMRTDVPEGEFKLNNNHRSRYARAVMDNNPDLDGIFDTRELRS